jgi:hypothetical protein
MRAKVVRNVVGTTMGALLLAGSLMAAPPASSPDCVAVDASAWDFQREASNLLGEVRALSGELRKDAEQLESFKLSNLSWQTHGDQLNRVKEQINAMGDRLERLQEIRHVTAPWQQQAIDRMVPVAAELASRTQVAIEHLNENRGYLFAPTYTDHLTTIAEQARTLNDSARGFVEYGETQEKLDQLREELEIRAS